MNSWFSTWLKANGLTIDDVLRSSLTILIYFAMVGFGLWFFFRSKLGSLFFAGFGGGALYLLYVNAHNLKKDKEASADIVNLSGGVDVSGGVTTGFTYQQFLDAQANGTI